MPGKPKAIVMVGGGIQEVPAVKQVQDMGYKCIVTDRNPYAPAFEGADLTIPVNAKATMPIVNYLRSILQRIDVVAIFTLTELYFEVSEISCLSKLPAVPRQVSLDCLRKCNTKKIWIEGGIPTAYGLTIETELDAIRFHRDANAPLFMKPNTGCGGDGCKRIGDERHLLREFWYAKPTFLLEEYLEGSVHDVNAVFDKHHKFFGLSISDRWFEDGVEIRAECPTFLDADKQAELYALTEKAALALGIDFGPVKADAMLTKDGFKFMEMAPRLHGPSGTLEMIPRALGFRPLEAAIHALVGNEIPEECMTPKWKKRCITHRKRNGEKWFEVVE